MFDLLIAIAAVATIANFLLDVITVIELKRKDSDGENKKSQN